MEERIIGDSREMVLKVLQQELGERARYQPSPSFSYTVGAFTLPRDGRLTWEDDEQTGAAAQMLANLGLVDLPRSHSRPEDDDFTFTTQELGARGLLNLLCMVSARQRLLNRALDTRGGLGVASTLMADLLAHPSPTVPGLVQALYGRQAEYRGINIALDHVELTGFAKAPASERYIQLQLVERMAETAKAKQWIKPLSTNARNQKYVFRTWLNTLESSGELLLTLFSCFAQEESRSISENTSWGIRAKFKQGIPHLNVDNLMGYRKGEDGRLVIDEQQAQVVRRVYRLFLEGFSLGAIARTLNADGVPGVRRETNWCATTIGRMLQNEKYKGALLMQKTYTANYLTKQHLPNTGQLEQYHIEHSHPAIIEPLEWEAVQEEITRRRAFREKHGLRGLGGSNGSAFYARSFCGGCGGVMRWHYPKGASRATWHCRACKRSVGNEELRAAFCAAFNQLVMERERHVGRWEEMLEAGTPLQRVRARQMLEITAEGKLSELGAMPSEPKRYLNQLSRMHRIIPVHSMQRFNQPTNTEMSE